MFWFRIFWNFETHIKRMRSKRHKLKNNNLGMSKKHKFQNPKTSSMDATKYGLSRFGRRGGEAGSRPLTAARVCGEFVCSLKDSLESWQLDAFSRPHFQKWAEWKTQPVVAKTWYNFRSKHDGEHNQNLRDLHTISYFSKKGSLVFHY